MFCSCCRSEDDIQHQQPIISREVPSMDLIINEAAALAKLPDDPKIRRAHTISTTPSVSGVVEQTDYRPGDQSTLRSEHIYERYKHRINSNPSGNSTLCPDSTSTSRKRLLINMKYPHGIYLADIH